jgi:hypothetical protein
MSDPRDDWRDLGLHEPRKAWTLRCDGCKRFLGKASAAVEGEDSNTFATQAELKSFACAHGWQEFPLADKHVDPYSRAHGLQLGDEHFCPDCAARSGRLTQ